MLLQSRSEFCENFLPFGIILLFWSQNYFLEAVFQLKYNVHKANYNNDSNKVPGELVSDLPAVCKVWKDGESVTR
jgi:hypothetical protein